MVTDRFVNYVLAVASGFIVGMLCFEQEPVRFEGAFPEPVAECKADKDHVCIRLPIDRD